MKRGFVAVLIVLLFLGILTWDVFLYSDSIDRNSISQVIIDWTAATPLVPWFIGFVMGALTIHWFEGYFTRKK